LVGEISLALQTKVGDHFLVDVLLEIAMSKIEQTDRFLVEELSSCAQSDVRDLAVAICEPTCIAHADRKPERRKRP
jgi:hypothetical protein